MEKQDIIYKKETKLKNFERKFNFFVGVSFLLSVALSLVFIMMKNVLLIESDLLVTTTLGTIFFVNLLINYFHKSSTNSWIYVSYPRYTERKSTVCEHRPSILTGFLGKLFKKTVDSHSDNTAQFHSVLRSYGYRSNW